MSTINPHPFVNDLYELHEALSPLQSTVRTSVDQLSARIEHLDSIDTPHDKHEALLERLINLDIELTTVLIQIHNIV